jgi:nucleoid DNA-binding protein
MDETAGTDKPLTKTQVLNTLAERTGLSKKDVSNFLDSLGDMIEENLKEGGPGQMTIPGLFKVKVQHKPATPEREGINPFTKEKTIFKAKPASSTVKVQPLKPLKDRF